MQRYLIIDGYNAINKIGELSQRRELSLESARMAFIKMLNDFMAQKHIFDRIFIVFDSKEKEAGIRKHSYGNVEVIFATSDRDADNVIVDMLRDAPVTDKISVSSDDNFVRNHTRAFGRNVISIGELKKIIMLKKPGERSKIKEKELKGDKIRGINEELKKRWGIE